MRSAILTVLICCMVGPGANAAQTLIDTDFGDAAYRDVQVFDKRGESVATGQLPNGWHDNSSWAQVKVHYTQAAEGTRRYLRFHHTDLISGRAQITCDVKEPTEDRYCRLTCTLRNPDARDLTIGLRQTAKPYQWAWRVDAPFSPEWRDYTFDFLLPRPPHPVRFFIVSNGIGTCDIARIRLESMSETEMAGLLATERRKTNPTPLPRNRFRITRLPLGLQNGWSVTREMEIGTDVDIAPSPDAPGPSGAPSLHVRVMQSGAQTSLHTAPMGWVDPLKPHVASFYVRGAIKGTVQVVTGRDADGSRKVDLDTKDKWQRIVVPFKPRLLRNTWGIRILARGDFYVDAFQVEEGTEPTSYRSAMPCEVALALPESDAAVARIQFEDEQPRFQWCVTGAPGSRSRLRIRLTNVYGDQRDLEPVSLKDTFIQAGLLDYGAFGKRPFGSFRIEAWVENASGERISTYNEIIVHRLRRPRYDGRDAPDSPFGVHTLPKRRHLLMAKAAGINWVRLHDAGLTYVGWYFLEREKGTWTFYDDKIDAYRKHHLKILGEFGTAPEWASYAQRITEPCKDTYRLRWFAPTDPAQFGNYCRVVAKRYKGIIDDWCMWNEPWAPSFFAFDYNPSKVKGWRGFIQPDTAPAYHAELTRQAWQNARAVNPGLRVAGVCTTRADSPDARSVRWTQGIVDAGGLQWCNAYDYHHYLDTPVGYPSDAIETTVRNAFAPVVEKNGGIRKPLWMTEGQPVRKMPGAGLYKHTVPPPSEDNIWEPSDRLARYMIRMLSVGVDRVFLYTMHGHHYFEDGARWSVLVTPEGYMHPCGAAHSALAWLIEDTHFLQTVHPRKDVSVYLFEGADRTVAAISPHPGAPPFPLPRKSGIRYLDLFGNSYEKPQVTTRMVYAVTSRPAHSLAAAFSASR